MLDAIPINPSTSKKLTDIINNSSNDIKEKLISKLLEISLKKQENLCYILRNKSTSNEGKQNVIFVIGGPGTGKGVQCNLLAKDYGFIHVSTGNLLRNEKDKNGPNANEIAKTQKEGGLVSSDLLCKLIKNNFEKYDNNANFVLDGFPRCQENLDSWNKILKDSVKVTMVINFTCSYFVMEERLIKRGKTSGRSDDNIETIKMRFLTYQNQTLPVLKKMRNMIFQINADQTIEEVYGQVKGALKANGFKKLIN